LCTFRIEVD